MMDEGVNNPLAELEEVITAVPLRVQAALAALDSQLEPCFMAAESAVDQMESALQELRDALDQCSLVMKSGIEQWNQELDAVTEGLDDLEDTFDEANECTNEAIDELEDCIEAIPGVLDQFKKEAEEKIQELLQVALESIDTGITEPLMAARNECIQMIAAKIDDTVEDFLPSKIEQVKEEWILEIKDYLDDIAEYIERQLREFQQAVLSGSDAAEGERQVSQVAVDALERLLQPVFAQVDRVRGLADSVGIHL